MLHGHLQISVYGVTDYKKLYAKVGFPDVGVLSGHSPPAEVLMRYIKNAGRPRANTGAPPLTLTMPSGEQRCTRPCTTHHDCPKNAKYICVADSGLFTNPQLLRGCCRFRYDSQVPNGVPLLRNKSTAQGGELSPQHGQTLRPPFPIGDYGCACNCTYTSQACCHTRDGLISEPASLRLGVLEPTNATACCDTESGIFSQGPRRTNSTYC